MSTELPPDDKKFEDVGEFKKKKSKIFKRLFLWPTEVCAKNQNKKSHASAPLKEFQ
jgi:hypothetical protein